MNNMQLLERLLQAYRSSPHPSFKVSNYFPIYVELFGHLVDQPCTFVETGILNGGSLFMWRSWLGPQARIIGVDLNPAAKQWEKHGFEIYIGDQGDPKFWQENFNGIGHFDAFLDEFWIEGIGSSTHILFPFNNIYNQEICYLNLLSSANMYEVIKNKTIE
jgi:hypothetical protein